jgi:hypothetical protein
LYLLNRVFLCQLKVKIKKQRNDGKALGNFFNLPNLIYRWMLQKQRFVVNIERVNWKRFFVDMSLIVLEAISTVYLCSLKNDLSTSFSGILILRVKFNVN